MADEQIPTDTAPPAAASDAAPEKPPMTEAQVGEWMNRIHASESVVRDLVDREHDGWKRNVQAYMGKVLAEMPRDHAVNVPLEYAYVELKKAAIAFQVPEVHLKPKNPQSAPAVPVFQAAVNHELGEENADAPTLIEEVATDVLLCGIAASKIGYVADIRTRTVPVMEPVIDPMTGQPQIDPQTQQPVQRQAQTPVLGPSGALVMGLDGQPVMEPKTKTERYVAHEEYFWQRFPTEHLLLPVDFEGSKFDRAAWIGMKFVMDFTQAEKQYKLPKDFAATIQTPRDTLSSDERPDRSGGSLKQVEGYEIWYQAAVFDPDDDPLPGQIKKLVLITGHNQPVELMDSPYQWLGDGEDDRPNDGKLHGMMGYPIHPLTLRFLPGSAYPVSDVGIARPISQEISTGRTQLVQFRDRALPTRWYNRDGLDPETKAKLERGEIMGSIGVDGNGNELIGIVALPVLPRENFSFNEVGTKDFEKAWGMGGAGTVEPEARTATEVNRASAVSDVRLDKERTRFLRWFTSGVAKFASLLQQFADDDRFAEIEGPDGAKAIQAWNRQMVQGEFVFQAKPDSALRLDADVDRRQKLALYNLLGRDPNANRVELLKPLVASHNLDPGRIVVETPPAEPKPEPPRVSYSFKGEDFALITKDGLPNTTFPIVMAIAMAGGLQIPPEAMENAKLLAEKVTNPMGTPSAPPAPAPPGAPPPQQQTAALPHGGAMPQMDPLNKHQLDQDAGALM